MKQFFLLLSLMFAGLPVFATEPEQVQVYLNHIRSMAGLTGVYGLEPRLNSAAGKHCDYWADRLHGQPEEEQKETGTVHKTAPASAGQAKERLEPPPENQKQACQKGKAKSRTEQGHTQYRLALSGSLYTLQSGKNWQGRI